MKRYTIPDVPSAAVAGGDIYARDVIVGTINEDSIDYNTNLSTTGTVTINETVIEGTRQVVTDTASTWTRAHQDGLGRVNYYLNATDGTSGVFTAAENALRIRYHNSGTSLYFGDFSGKSIGDPIVWTLAWDFVFDSVQHTFDVFADLTCDDLDGTVITASQALVSSTLQQNADAFDFTAHNTTGTQATNGLAIHRMVNQNDDGGGLITTGVQYHLKYNNGGYYRTDIVVNGVYTTGLLYVGGANGTANVGISQPSPIEKLDVNGNVRANSVRFVPVTAASITANNSLFVDASNGNTLSFRDNGGIVRTVNLT